MRHISRGRFSGQGKVGKGGGGGPLLTGSTASEPGGRGEERAGTSPTSQITSLTAGKTQLWHTDRQSQTQGAAGAEGGRKK